MCSHVYAQKTGTWLYPVDTTKLILSKLIRSEKRRDRLKRSSCGTCSPRWHRSLSIARFVDLNCTFDGALFLNIHHRPFIARCSAFADSQNFGVERNFNCLRKYLLFPWKFPGLPRAAISLFWQLFGHCQLCPDGFLRSHTDTRQALSWAYIVQCTIHVNHKRSNRIRASFHSIHPGRITHGRTISLFDLSIRTLYSNSLLVFVSHWTFSMTQRVRRYD